MEDVKYEDVCEIKKGTKEFKIQASLAMHDSIIKVIGKAYVIGDISFRRYEKLMDKHVAGLSKAWGKLRKYAGMGGGVNVRINRDFDKVFIQVEIEQNSDE